MLHWLHFSLPINTYITYIIRRKKNLIRVKSKCSYIYVCIYIYIGMRPPRRFRGTTTSVTSEASRPCARLAGKKNGKVRTLVYLLYKVTKSLCTRTLENDLPLGGSAAPRAFWPAPSEEDHSTLCPRTCLPRLPALLLEPSLHLRPRPPPLPSPWPPVSACWWWRKLKKKQEIKKIK